MVSAGGVFEDVGGERASRGGGDGAGGQVAVAGDGAGGQVAAAGDGAGGQVAAAGGGAGGQVAAAGDGAGGQVAAAGGGAGGQVAVAGDGAGGQVAATVATWSHLQQKQKHLQSAFVGKGCFSPSAWVYPATPPEPYPPPLRPGGVGSNREGILPFSRSGGVTGQ